MSVIKCACIQQDLFIPSNMNSLGIHLTIHASISLLVMDQIWDFSYRWKTKQAHPGKLTSPKGQEALAENSKK